MADISQHVEILGLAASGAGDFGSQALEWTAFFSTVAQVSGSLVGLVFLALTFNGKLAGDGDPALRHLARQTFADFLSLLVVSLALLVPHALPASVSVFMLITGALGVMRILRALFRMLRGPDYRNSGIGLIQRFLLSMLGNIGLLAAGALLLSPDYDRSAFWSTVFGSVVGLLLSGSRSAWMLVVPDRRNES